MKRVVVVMAALVLLKSCPLTGGSIATPRPAATPSLSAVLPTATPTTPPLTPSAQPSVEPSVTPTVEPTTALECPTSLYAAFLPGGQIGLWHPNTIIPPASLTTDATLEDAHGKPVAGAFSRENENAPLLFTPNAYEDELAQMLADFKHDLDEYLLKYKSDACTSPVSVHPNAANLLTYFWDGRGDVIQHMNPGQPASNAAPYDDILATYVWYDSFPFTPEEIILLNRIAEEGEKAAYESVFQSLSGGDFTYTFGNQTLPGLDGMPIGPGTVDFLDKSDRSRISVYLQDTLTFGRLTVAIGLRYDGEWPGAALMPRLAALRAQPVGQAPVGFQLFGPGEWQFDPLLVRGDNFEIKLSGAWSGVAFDPQSGETAVWVARGTAESAGVILQGPDDGAHLALMVISPDGLPGEAQQITPAELGERFGVYTSAMPGRLTFETWLAGPFSPWPLTQEMLNSMAWQILLDMDGDTATGASRDFLAARGLGYEVFYHSQGESVSCSAVTAAGEFFSCPNDLFSILFDPAGRVVMSAAWSDLQAIAAQAGIELDISKLRWRFSHINSQLDSMPQDIFPEQ